MTRLLLGLALALVPAIFLSPASLPGTEKITEHPIIKPLPEVINKSGTYYKFNAHKFRIKTEEGKQEKEIRGKYWEFVYNTTKEVFILYILENYKAAALEKGGTILFEDDRYVVFTLPTPEGGTLWVEVYAGWNDR
jgi:hypothetical protein